MVDESRPAADAARALAGRDLSRLPVPSEAETAVLLAALPKHTGSSAIRVPLRDTDLDRVAAAAWAAGLDVGEWAARVLAEAARRQTA